MKVLVTPTKLFRIQFLSHVHCWKYIIFILSSKNTIKEEDEDDTSSDEDSEVDKPEESNDGINNTKDHNGKTTNENKIEKHVRIMEKENSEIVSSSEIETSDNTEKKKSDAKKSKFCVLLWNWKPSKNTCTIVKCSI